VNFHFAPSVARMVAGVCFFASASRRDGACRDVAKIPSAGRAYIRRPVAGNQLKERESVGEYDLTKLTDEELRQLECILMSALRAPQATVAERLALALLHIATRGLTRVTGAIRFLRS
jgi:hypothetical protein